MIARNAPLDPDAESRAFALLEQRRGKAAELSQRLAGALPALADFQAMADREARAVEFLSKMRGRKPIQPAPSANAFLTPIIKPLLSKAGVGLEELKRNWLDIAGKEFAHTAPEKITGKTLTVRTPGAFATQLQQTLGTLLSRCQTAGLKVEKIVIRQGSVLPARPPVAAPPRADGPAVPDADLEGVASPRLKAALQRLGRAVRSA